MISEEIKEKLSAMLDGELSRDEQLALMKEITNNDKLWELWQSYYLIKLVFKKHKTLACVPQEKIH